MGETRRDDDSRAEAADCRRICDRCRAAPSQPRPATTPLCPATSPTTAATAPQPATMIRPVAWSRRRHRYPPRSTFITRFRLLPTTRKSTASSNSRNWAAAASATSSRLLGSVCRRGNSPCRPTSSRRCTRRCRRPPRSRRAKCGSTTLM